MKNRVATVLAKPIRTAMAAAAPISPASSRFRMAIDATLVSGEYRNTTAEMVVMALMKEVAGHVHQRGGTYRQRHAPEGLVKRHLERGTDRFKLTVQGLQRGHSGQMAGGVKVHDGAQRQQREGVVQPVERVGGGVEEEDIAQAQHQPGTAIGTTASRRTNARRPSMPLVFSSR
jgi:hypothetical protein